MASTACACASTAAATATVAASAGAAAVQTPPARALASASPRLSFSSPSLSRQAKAPFKRIAGPLRTARSLRPKAIADETTTSTTTSTTSEDGSSGNEQLEVLIKDLQEKWDAVENKQGVALYGGGALVALWLSSTIVSALNSLPLLPKVLELVGLGYTSWFVYRYLLFKQSREELSELIDELKAKITGTSTDA
ncbi:hypothetical protein CBR_g3554 [Chara braunii]|uniref:Cyanobacterial aminoacyl-tRNA synthetase CAAD domain-containing protein n=1 Tax=Chara braunii TaxID=69332 RepID=A0A388KFP6_CHABU|nr:hypothetical protein CBR_g3554 [Chara braunii]|eukprot:GBG68861.1 hypothetical protein CBR_g3554 [Chara braunii]